MLSEEAHETPSDTKKIDELTPELPEWFNEDKFNQARRFYWHNCYGLTSAMLLGMVNVLAVPSILRILVGARRSDDVYPAFKRYVSTFLHAISWFESDLKPGSWSWESLLKVRRRHIRMTLAAKVKGQGLISQRDLVLTQFGFVGLTVLKPDKFGIQTLEDGDWEAYNQFWRVIGFMIGIKERYNICQRTIEETRQVCRLIVQRVYTPCLNDPPEYFEYMARIMLEGVSSSNPTVDTPSLLYWTKYLTDVPGYVYTEDERKEFQSLLRKKLNGSSDEIGVDSTHLISKSAVGDLPGHKRLLFVRDYDSFKTVPEYKQLPLISKCKLALNSFFTSLYTTKFGRKFLNAMFLFSINVMKQYPRIAFFLFNVKVSLANIFNYPLDNTGLKPNSLFYKLSN
ncbi:unnamed protein product [Parnassius mnemosyne]|uniref:ER-bound oxygenase mpaB/mpaB'/Rubber oxygenase catalytic domain-containing protein n=1 Tax=Parnassius mnemosyne TaxID=213953 RepID=A0AAV1L8Q4_9NEOP